MKKLFLYVVAAVVALGGAVGPSPAPAHAAVAKKRQATVVEPPVGLWQEIDESSLGASKQADRVIVPRAYRVFHLDEQLLRETLDRVPLEFTEAAKAGPEIVLTIPMPDGSLQRFRVQESPIMEPALAARFPEIRTFIARGIDDPAATVRLDHTPLGFHAQILSPNGAVYVDPFLRGSTETYVTYFKRDYVRRDDTWHCDVVGGESEADKIETPSSVNAVVGQTLRTYRLALACTVEYATAVCGHLGQPVTVANTLSAMTTSVNRVDGVYENEFAIRMVLIANDDLLVHTTNPDPYTNNNGSTMLGENQTSIDSIIGSGNYDIGHVFSTGGGGIAGLGVVCRGGQKARGVTGSGAPYGDSYDIDYVAHEMGHQFGGNHTFNGTSGSCGGGNRNGSTAYEPGSGSTIMAYAGICGSVDLQPHSDPYFHAKSFDEIVAYTNSGSGNGCAVQTSTGNVEPTVDAGAAYTVPANTAFELTAPTASDPNGDNVTYCWEEFDLGPALNTGSDNGSSPLFRSLNPTTNPTRRFESFANPVPGNLPWGVLPTTNRTMTFRCTVRDNRVGGGGVSFDTTTVTSSTSAGPFSVTSPNSNVTWAGASAQTITWNVANTNAAPVNAANVSILLSIDGGATYPIVLRASTPNDGSEVVTIPNVPTSQARIKVKGAGNVFYDTSNTNFTISGAVTGGDSVGIYLGTSGAFFLRNSNSAGAADSVFGYGPSPSTFVPLMGDWNGDHVDTSGLYDPATGFFFLKNSSGPGGADLVFSFGPGGLGFVPLRGDWDGDGVDTIGLYDPATGNFFLKNTNAGGGADAVFSFGAGGLGFVPLTGDWNGDLRDTVGLYDPGTGGFFLRNSNASGPADLVFSFGPAGVTPLVGDWNLDGTDTVGIYISGTGSWFLRNSNTPGGADVVFGYGPPGVTPLVGDWDGL